MSKFIQIINARILISSIKRYTPFKKDIILIYYTSTRQKIDNEGFKFENESERDEVLLKLDSIFLT